MPLFKKTCRFCGIEFETRDGRQVFHNRACYCEYQKSREYRLQRSEATKAARRRGCYDNMYTDEVRKKMMGRRPRGPQIPKRCEQCGTSFEVPPCQEKRRFCCLKCYREFQSSDQGRCENSESRKGGHVSEQARRKISKALKGRRFTKEHRRKMSEAQKGQIFSEERKHNISKAIKAAWAQGKFSNAHSKERNKKVSEKLKAAWVRGCFDGVFHNPSSLELDVATFLDGLDIDYERQYRPEGMGKPFDFYFPLTHVLLEVQGDYWHTLPGVPEDDIQKATEATNLGFRVCAVWEHEIGEQGMAQALHNVLGTGL